MVFTPPTYTQKVRLINAIRRTNRQRNVLYRSSSRVQQRYVVDVAGTDGVARPVWRDPSVFRRHAAMADVHGEEEIMTQGGSFEDRFVTRREYYRDHRDIMDKFAKQDVKFERMEGRTQRMLDDLDELPDALDKLGGTLDKINGRLTDVE